MNNGETRTYEMLRRVRDFGASRTTDFPAAGLGGQMFAEVTAVVTELEHHDTVQSASTGVARVSSAAKARLRTTLREDLRAINRTARAIAVERPDLKKKFRLPQAGDGHLLTAARAFAEEAEPLAAEFTKHEMPAGFIAKLKSDIDAFEDAVTERNRSAEDRVRATASLQAVLERGLKAKQHLDVVVRNKFATDKPSLAAWESASHVERNNGKSRDAEKPDVPKPDPAKPKSSGATVGD